MSTTTMKAMIIEDYCEEPNFIESEQAKPIISKPNQVLVKLYAASVNPVDYKVRKGGMKAIMTLQFPLILGKDGSGIVEQVGEEVSRFKVGDKVAGFLPFRKTGTYAEYAIFEEDEIVKYSNELSHQQAAAFPLAGCTIMEMLRKHSEVFKVLEREGHNSYKTGRISDPLPISEKKPLKILIVGASGGTGLAACIICKQFLSRYFNTTIYGVCSERNSKLVSDMGADVIIDYSKTSARAGSNTTHSTGGLSNEKSICQIIKENGDEHVDVVLDCVGGYYYYDDVCQTLDCSKAPNGCVFTTIGTPTSENQVSISTVFKIGYYIISNKVKGTVSSSYPSFYMFMMVKNVNDMHLLLNHVVVSNRAFEQLPLLPFKLEQVKEAHLQIQSQRTVGKIIIDHEMTQ